MGVMADPEYELFAIEFTNDPRATKAQLKAMQDRIDASSSAHTVARSPHLLSTVDKPRAR